MIYQTSDTLASIRKMAAENARAVVVQQFRCFKTIPTILNRVADIPSITCRSWDSNAVDALNRWAMSRKLLFYRPYPVGEDELFPECDSVLFLECPQQYADFERTANKVRGDVIIFRPPSWKLHEETIDLRYPMGYHTRALLAMIAGLRTRELTPRMLQALEFSGYDPNLTSVFTAEDAKIILGMPERQLKAALKYRFRGFYTRYEVYRPMYKPINSDEEEMFEVLMNEPDLGGGWRMLRFGELKDGRVPEFKRYLKHFTRKHNVFRSPSIYLLTDGFRPPNYDIIDAIGNVRQGSWFKMRTLVDSAPDYLNPHPTDIQSEPHG